jgi:hypothetical protein
MDTDIKNYCLEQMTNDEKQFFLQNEKTLLPGVIIIGKEFLAIEKLHKQLNNATNLMEYSIAIKELFEYFIEPRMCLHSSIGYRNMILSLGFKMKNIIQSGFSLADIPVNENIYDHFSKMATFDWDGLVKTIDNVISIIQKMPLTFDNLD